MLREFPVTQSNILLTEMDMIMDMEMVKIMDIAMVTIITQIIITYLRKPEQNIIIKH